MNLYKVNFNLLKVFHVLMQEQHISRAAAKLYLTQPAVSSSLQQLRELFNDELLIRTPKKMIPTKKALLLAPKVSQVLSNIECIISFEDEFNYKTAERTFTLGMTDYSEFIILPTLYKYLHEQAPNISLRIVATSDFSPEKFESNQLDLGIGIYKDYSKQMNVQPFFTDRAVCAARESNPIFNAPLTLERYVNAEHFSIAIHSYTSHLAEEALRELKVKREIKVVFSSIMPALETMAATDLVGTLPRNIVLFMRHSLPIKFVELPFSMPEVMLAFIWNRQSDADPGLIWLRSVIEKVSKAFKINSNK